MFTPLKPFFFLFLALIAILAIKLALKALANAGGPAFKLKSPLLSVPEQDLYRRLVAALPDHVILAQVAFSQMIKVEGGERKENFGKFATARQKVADFVVCDKSFKVVAVVELDDSTHSREKDERRDAIIHEAGSKTIRWRTANRPTTEEIRRQVL